MSILRLKSFQFKDTFMTAITPSRCSLSFGWPKSGVNHWVCR